LHSILGPICENGIWRIKYNKELYEAYGDVEIIKTMRIRWLGHLYREKETDQCRKVTFTIMDGKRNVGRPNIRWIDGVEQDLKVLRVQGWKGKAVDGYEWRKIIDKY
ncbi:hypothetical protein C0J52_18836, partial [Blattella germanica]